MDFATTDSIWKNVKMSKKRTSYVHCSWDIIQPLTFTPRIPFGRMGRLPNGIAEDSTTPRVCVTSSINNALAAMPGTGKVIKSMRMARVPVIIHTYYLSIDEKYVYKPSKEEVPDVEWTGELWLLKEPDKVIRRDYLITDEFIYHTRNQYGKDYDKFIGCDISLCKFTDNYVNFVKNLSENSLGNPDENVLQIMKEHTSFRSLMQNLDEEFLEQLKEAIKCRISTKKN